MIVWGVSSGSAVAAAPVVSAPVAAVYAQAVPDDHPDMPNGPGKDITIKTCTKCHSITNITGNHKDKDGWTATITKMVGYGATGTDDEFEAILNYVTKNYGLDSPAPAAPSNPPAPTTPPATPPGSN